MPKSRYLEKLIENCNEHKASLSKRTLISTIILAVIAAASYLAISASDSRAASTAIMVSGLFGIVCIVFLIKFINLSRPVSEKTILKCEEEIKKNLAANETVEDFDSDMENPAFGGHMINNGTVLVGRKYVLFKNISDSGPSIRILRGDNLGDFKIYYSSQTGTTGDIGMDIKDKNGKFLRSFFSPDKEKFYKLLDAMEKIKKCANGNDAAFEGASGEQVDPFVDEAKARIAGADRKSRTKLAIFGLIIGIFLTIAGNSSGIGFIYGGLALFVISLAALIFFNVKHK